MGCPRYRIRYRLRTLHKDPRSNFH